VMKSRRLTRWRCICCPGCGRQHTALASIKSGLAALRDFDLAYRRFGSFASFQWATRLRDMSAMPPIAIAVDASQRATRYAKRRPEQVQHRTLLLGLTRSTTKRISGAVAGKTSQATNLLAAARRRAPRAVSPLASGYLRIISGSISPSAPSPGAGTILRLSAP
jgi:hypothetical protein